MATSVDGNAELELAWQLVEKTGVNVFLTGKAGTGKTTFLRRLKASLPKRMVVVAPTGVAAINAEGVTIHSFFQLPLSPFVPGGTVKTDGDRRYQFGKEKRNIIRTLDLLVIDEVSMVRADLLDAVDDVLRRYRDSRLPFGGVQLLMIGDLQQLPPVVKDDEWQMLRQWYDTPFFFGSRALQQTRHVTIELQRVYRQSDNRFVEMLGHVREGSLTAADLALLNTRVRTGREPVDGIIRLTTHNRTADRWNDERLRALPGSPQHYKASVEGTFPATSFPADETLTVKPGCQVMFLKNDPSPAHQFYNGKLGRVVEATNDTIRVEGLDDHRVVEVKPMEWTNARYVIDKESKEIREEVDGVFSQYPLRLAWAITIHKSQGLTFDRAVLDVGAAFAAGQTYVALSRLRSLEGLVLTEPLSPQAVIVDGFVTRYMADELQQAATLGQHIGGLQKEYYQHLLGELFDYQPIRWALQKVTRLVDEHLYRQYPRLLARFKEAAPRLAEEVFDVAPRFMTQCAGLLADSNDYEHDEQLSERIHKACRYFEDKTFTLLNPLLTDSKSLESDNRKVAEQLDEALDSLRRAVELKVALLRYVFNEGFQVGPYLKRKATVVLDMETGKGSAYDQSATAKNKKKGERTAARATDKRKKASLPSKEQTTKLLPKPARTTGDDRTTAEDADISYPELYQTLRRWRAALAFKEQKGAYLILSNAALIAIVNALPTNMAELKRVKGMGPAKCAEYGTQLLEIVRDYVSENADW